MTLGPFEFRMCARGQSRCCRPWPRRAEIRHDRLQHLDWPRAHILNSKGPNVILAGLVVVGRLPDVRGGDLGGWRQAVRPYRRPGRAPASRDRAWGRDPAAVSYTHLTLPTNREV